jgi:hypothetical protein
MTRDDPRGHPPAGPPRPARPGTTRPAPPGTGLADSLALWREAWRIRRGHPKWAVLWAADAHQFQAFRLSRKHRTTVLAAATPEDLTAQIEHAEQAEQAEQAGRAHRAAPHGTIQAGISLFHPGHGLGMSGGIRAAVYPGLVREEAPEGRYEDLIDDLAGIDGVTPPRGGGGFGRSACRFRGKIFVMLVRGRLVVKLPAERVDALIAAGDGVRFDANKGTPMKEWFSLDPESERPWLPLAREALDYARPGG